MRKNLFFYLFKTIIPWKVSYVHVIVHKLHLCMHACKCVRVSVFVVCPCLELYVSQ